MVKPKIENETRTEKFRRIAAARTNRVLNDLRLLGNCSNPGIYAYSKEDVDRIFTTIQKELKRVRSMYKKEKVEFTLD